MITAERLREVLRYEPLTGLWFWRVSKCPIAQAGSSAGSLNEGRRRIEIDGRSYYANQLAWLYMTGRSAKAKVDHENLDRSDDRWENLREATVSQNAANSRARSHNRSGLKGVTLTPHGTYQARIRHNGTLYNLGSFRTKEAAHAAYVAAALNFHGEFARAA